MILVQILQYLAMILQDLTTNPARSCHDPPRSYQNRARSCHDLAKNPARSCRDPPRSYQNPARSCHDPPRSYQKSCEILPWSSNILQKSSKILPWPHKILPRLWQEHMADTEWRGSTWNILYSGYNFDWIIQTNVKVYNIAINSVSVFIKL